uniref:Uncharacterized protein n=1 Tax=Oryza sativa subsp. japonica TaxID=39947 RepID=Q2QTC4_ORYSJ|nr:hypothetical protein LOC_Os12g20130 [Oryza sativa Japonica Group]
MSSTTKSIGMKKSRIFTGEAFINEENEVEIYRSISQKSAGDLQLHEKAQKSNLIITNGPRMYILWVICMPLMVTAQYGRLPRSLYSYIQFPGVGYTAVSYFDWRVMTGCHKKLGNPG